MAHRQILDDQKCMWDVWEVIPTLVEKENLARRAREPRISGKHSLSMMVPDEMRNGWLAFQCDDRRRRLSPIPDNWSQLTDEELLSLLGRAPAVRPAMRRQQPD